MLIDLGGQFGGVERYVISLTQLLGDSADIHVLCVLPELAQKLEAEGLRPILLPAFSGVLKPLRFLVAFLVMPIAIVRNRIQIVQVNGFLESVLMLPARLLQVRTVYTRHGPFELLMYPWYRHPLKFLPRALARLSVHLATKVVCVSEAVGLEVRAIRLKVPVIVIPNWIASQPPAKPARLASGAGLMLVCASRLEKYKGIQLVIDAMRGVEGIRLTVVGDGPFRRELERLSAHQPVKFLGYQQDMHPYYEAADIFVMPSLGPEGLPLSNLEAMGRGLPCIFSDLPVHREITEEGQGALLFQSGSVDSLRIALQALVADVALRSRIGASAYRIVRERYTEEMVKSAYLKIFGAE